MLSATRTIVINRPVHEVFAFFTNPENDMTWRRHVSRIGTDGPVGLGSTIRQTVKGPGGRDIPADIRVTAFEPDTRYAFTVTAGPVRPRGEMRFVPAAGGTELSFSLEAELGGVKKILMSGPVQRSMNGEMASLDTAKALIEGR